MITPHKKAQAELVLTHLGTARTQKDLAQLTGLAPGTVSCATTFLKARRLIHIASHSGENSARVYLAGNQPDAVRPPAGASLLDKRAGLVLHALKHADLTSAQLMAATGLQRHMTYATLDHLHTGGQIHIHAYSGNTDSQRVYRRGAGVDAKPRAKIRREIAKPMHRAPPPDPLTAALFGR